MNIIDRLFDCFSSSCGGVSVPNVSTVQLYICRSVPSLCGLQTVPEMLQQKNIIIIIIYYWVLLRKSSDIICCYIVAPQLGGGWEEEEDDEINCCVF